MASKTESVEIDGSVVGRMPDKPEHSVGNDSPQHTQHSASDATGRGGVYGKVDHKASGPSKCTLLLPISACFISAAASALQQLKVGSSLSREFTLRQLRMMFWRPSRSLEISAAFT